MSDKGSDSGGGNQSLPPRRKHRANGKPNGGQRPGAGRPEGALGTAPYGTKKAIKAAKGLRVPEGASEDQRAIADWCQQRILDVASGRCKPAKAHTILASARALREEICGPIPQKTQIDGALTVNLLINTKDSSDGV